MARDFGSAESTKIAGILCVFPNFGTARMGQKTRHPVAAELFRGSLVQGEGPRLSLVAADWQLVVDRGFAAMNLLLFPPADYPAVRGPL